MLNNVKNFVSLKKGFFNVGDGLMKAKKTAIYTLIGGAAGLTVALGINEFISAVAAIKDGERLVELNEIKKFINDGMRR